MTLLITKMRCGPLGGKPVARGMTLLEAVVVLSLLVILLAIFLPLNLSTDTDRLLRAKRSRVRADLRSMATGIESYYVDHTAYPDALPMAAFKSDLGGTPVRSAWIPTAPDPGRDDSHHGLTTPIAYITSLPRDPFAKTPGVPFAYYRDKEIGWILISPGPDGDYDIDAPRDYDVATTVPSVSLIMHTYDPSNGTKSDGDIYRVKD